MMRLNVHIVLLCCILLCGCGGKPRANWAITLKKEQKNPYDLYLARHALPYYFPEAVITDLKSSYDFRNLYAFSAGDTQSRGLLLISANRFFLNSRELAAVLDFAAEGNEVLFFCSQPDRKLQDTLRFSMISGLEYAPLTRTNKGSANRHALQLSALPRQSFGFNGRNIRSYFILDTSAAGGDSYESGISKLPQILGTAADTLPDLIRYTVGNGHISLHASPLVLSNYFLLQPGNEAYLAHIWQSIPYRIHSVAWWGYYNRLPKSSGLAVLLQHPATRWFLILFCLTILVFLIFQTKRRQRIIPVISRPQNTSVAFVETVGMLYFNKGDNHNLALKMIQHFLEWVRSNYFLQTGSINDIFAEQLTLRSGLPPMVINDLLELLHKLRLDATVTDEELYRLHELMQQFYKTKAS